MLEVAGHFLPRKPLLSQDSGSDFESEKEPPWHGRKTGKVTKTPEPTQGKLFCLRCIGACLRMLYLAVDSDNDFEGGDDQSSRPTTPEDDTSGAALDNLCSNSGVERDEVAVVEGAGSGMSLCIFVLLVLLDLCFRFTRERRGGRGW